MILWYVLQHFWYSHLIKCYTAFHKFFSTHGHSQIALPWSPSSVDQRHIPGPPCQMGPRLSTCDTQREGCLGDYWGHWLLVWYALFFALWFIKYVILESWLYLRSLVFTGLQMAVILSSGQVMTQWHWWRYMHAAKFWFRHTNPHFWGFHSAIAGYVPSAMVCCIAAFMDTCYITRRNVIDSPALEWFQDCVQTYCDLHTVFLEAGLNINLSVPHQCKGVHSLMPNLSCLVDGGKLRALTPWIPPGM